MGRKNRKASQKNRGQKHPERKKSPTSVPHASQEKKVFGKAKPSQGKSRPQQRPQQTTSQAPNRSSIAPRSTALAPVKKLPPGANTKAIVGRVDLHPDGFGFLIPKDPTIPNIYLPEETLKGIMNRDEVLVSVTERYDSGAKLRGQIIEIKKRSQTEFIGLLRFFKGGALVIPSEMKDRKHAFRIESVSDRFAQLPAGSTVLCKILQYPDRIPATAEIVDVVKDPEAASNDTLRIVVSSNWPRHFTKESLKDAEQRAMNWRSEMQEEKDRRDIRNLPLVTIDGRDAKDFDDAVCAKVEGENIRLWVAIADVSHFVSAGTELDQEAFERSTSVYFPDHVIPMLPEILSNGVCSLNPFEDRACMVAEMVIDPQGLVSDFEMYPGLMMSKRRLTYEQMQAFMEKEPWALSEMDSLSESLNATIAVFERLLKAKQLRGSIDLDIAEAHVQLSKSGEVVDIQPRSRLNSHRLIEECMLIANQCAAKFIHEKSGTGVYRIHEEPDQRKIDDLVGFLSLAGVDMNRLQNRIRRRRKTPQDPFKSPIDFQVLLQEINESFEAGSPIIKAINTLVLRSMKQARYSINRIGHFALAAVDYTHFTSPIRRYPDLMVHRLIKDALRKSQIVDQTKLEANCIHCSDQERLAMDMERKLIDTKKCRYMEHRLGEEFDAWVNGITEKGLFCQIDGHFVDGLLNADDIYKASKHTFDAKTLSYVGPSKSRIGLGSKLRIQLTAVNIETRRIDFHLIKVYENWYH